VIYFRYIIVNTLHKGDNKGNDNNNNNNVITLILIIVPYKPYISLLMDEPMKVMIQRFRRFGKHLLFPPGVETPPIGFLAFRLFTIPITLSWLRGIIDTNSQVFVIHRAVSCISDIQQYK
jgi:hypothetical protein